MSCHLCLFVRKSKKPLNLIDWGSLLGESNIGKPKLDVNKKFGHYCQAKIEMSYSYQSRNVLFSGFGFYKKRGRLKKGTLVQREIIIFLGNESRKLGDMPVQARLEGWWGQVVSPSLFV